MSEWPDPAIGRTPSGRLRLLAAAAHVEREPPQNRDGSPTMPSASFDNDLADLNDRGQVRVVRNVAHDFLGMWSEAGLKRLD